MVQSGICSVVGIFMVLINATYLIKISHQTRITIAVIMLATGTIFIVLSDYSGNLYFFIVGVVLLLKGDAIGMGAIFGIAKAFSVWVSKSLGVGMGVGSVVGTIIVLFIEGLSINYMYSFLPAILLVF